MTPRPHPSDSFAPLQRLMLNDSWASSRSDGVHLAQVEIQFVSSISLQCVSLAWSATVSTTDALRMAFSVENGIPRAHPLSAIPAGQSLKIEPERPACWDAWRKLARQQIRLGPAHAPWTAHYWPAQRRLIWTFHHALLDGRSIARVLENFLHHLADRASSPLPLATWRRPGPEEVDAAKTYFQTLRPHLTRPSFPDSMLDLQEQGASSEPRPAIRHLGRDFAETLNNQIASHPTLSVPSLLIWTWGQSLCELAKVDSVVVEQVRCGPRVTKNDVACAGFTMTTFPILIHRAEKENWLVGLDEFRRALTDLRDIEAVSDLDFPPGEFPDLSAAAASVIMVERGTLRHMVGEVACAGLLESLELHEPTSEWPTASAYLLPTMQLQVEGPGRHLLLEAWIRHLQAALPLIRDAGA